MGVAREVHGAEVVGGASGCLEERGDEFPGGGECAEVGPGEELEEDVVAEDVSEGGGGEVVAGEVVVGGEVSVGDGEDGEGGAVGEIRRYRRGGGEERRELGEVRHGGEQRGEVKSRRRWWVGEEAK